MQVLMVSSSGKSDGSFEQLDQPSYGATLYDISLDGNSMLLNLESKSVAKKNARF